MADFESHQILSAKKPFVAIQHCLLKQSCHENPGSSHVQRINVNKRIHFLHHSAGRIRIQVDGLKGNARLSEMIQTLPDKVPGIEQITASTITGSVLIRYDKSNPDILPRLQSMVDDAEYLLDMIMVNPDDFAQQLRAHRIP